jgi:hypothetical protein
MRIRSLTITIKNNRELKKNSYLILKKLHDLGMGKKIGRIYDEKSLKDEYLIVICFKNYEKFLTQCIHDDQYPQPPIISNYVERLHSLINTIQESAQKRKKIDKKKVSEFLKYHTKTFRYLAPTRSFFEFDEEIRENWHMFILLTIGIWGNEIRPISGRKNG